MYDFFKTHKDMTFMWAETIFLEHWWRKQNRTVREDVREWIRQKRFDLVTGSWVMTDEANPYFPVTVDNIVEGFQFINKEFGVKPSVLFSLDPFGHSNSIAYLYSQAGIHREVINRISSDTKEFLRGIQAHQFIWKQYFDEISEDGVWTHVLPYSHYDIPSTCGPDPRICCEIDVFRYYKHYPCSGDVKPIDKGNVQIKAKGLSNQLMVMSKQYVSNVVIMFYGDDFRFTTPFEWKVQYEALRYLFDEINSKDQIQIGFGTISKYFDELEAWYSENGVQPPALRGDFFPYESRSKDDQRISAILDRARILGLPVKRLTHSQFDKITDFQLHNGICLDASPLSLAREVSSNHLTSIYLDNVLDPGNLGAIARSATFFGCYQIAFSDGRGPSRITPAMSKASCGALESFRVARVPSFAHFHESLKSAGASFIGTSDASSAPRYGK
ncbi:glycosyl hydrolase family 38 protein, partial [Cooperia oncophora]